jgi:hypothetical protein
VDMRGRIQQMGLMITRVVSQLPSRRILQVGLHLIYLSLYIHLYSHDDINILDCTYA